MLVLIHSTCSRTCACRASSLSSFGFFIRSRPCVSRRPQPTTGESDDQGLSDGSADAQDLSGSLGPLDITQLPTWPHLGWDRLSTSRPGQQGSVGAAVVLTLNPLLLLQNHGCRSGRPSAGGAARRLPW